MSKHNYSNVRPASSNGASPKQSDTLDDDGRVRVSVPIPDNGFASMEELADAVAGALDESLTQLSNKRKS